MQTWPAWGHSIFEKITGSSGVPSGSRLHLDERLTIRVPNLKPPDPIDCIVPEPKGGKGSGQRKHESRRLEERKDMTSDGTIMGPRTGADDGLLKRRCT